MRLTMKIVLSLITFMKIVRSVTFVGRMKMYVFNKQLGDLVEDGFNKGGLDDF